MIRVEFHTNKIELVGWDYNNELYSKTYRRKDKFFRDLRRQVELGYIKFDMSDNYINYENVKDSNNYSIEVSGLTEIEKNIFINLIKLSNSKDIKEKREIVLDKLKGKNSKFYECFKKNICSAISFKNPAYIIGFMFSLFGISVMCAVLSQAGASFNPFVLYSPMTLPAFIIPTISSLIKTGNTISNEKYQLSEEEYKKKIKRGKRKSYKEKKLDKSLDVLEKVEKTNIPTLEGEIIKELDEIYKLINNIDDKNVKQEYLKKILEKVKEYNGKDTVNVDSETSLEIVLKQCSAAELLLFLQGLKRKIVNDTNQSIINSKMSEFKALLSEEVCEEITDDLSQGGVFKI